ncbi:MAG: DUF262 domain-containing protein [Paraclostridium sordellii]
MIGLEFIVKIKNIEYKEIAAYLGISPQSVSDWIKGKRRVPEKRCEQLSELFRVDKDLIGKELDENEKLKLHYDISNLNKNLQVIESNDAKIEQISFDIEEDNEHDKKIYTTSNLEEKVKNERMKVKIKEADIMISQLKEMYDDRESIDVHPEFQRIFRWTPIQKSRFIESILLGIPIPPIFVAEDEDLNWDVIDGVQRLSTIFEFIGILKDDSGKVLEPTVLVGTKTLKELDGKVWDNKTFEHRFSFEQSKYLKNAFLNATLKVIKVDSESDSKVKYDIFDRLNTGGSILSPQEIRNCLAIMLNRDFYTWLRQLSYNPDFITCTPFTENARKKQEDLEYVLRFMVYRNISDSEYSNSDNIRELITDKMKEFCMKNNLDYKKEKEIFDKTFELLSKSLKGDVFRKYDIIDGKFKDKMQLSIFEIIAIGVANNLDRILAMENSIDYITEKIKSLYSDPQYLELQKSKIASQRAVTKFSILTKFGTQYFSY